MESLAIKSRIRSLLRSPSTRLRKSRSGEQQSSKVTLERVLGITSTGNSGLTCDPSSGTVAYPAGCVVVLLNPVKNTQKHLINSSRKSISAVNFSSDGRYLVTGESGHLPAVRVWDVSEGMQLCELLEHKYGVSCVAFSPNSKYIVSVGSQHDMSVLVWAWKRNALVAANKVSSRVTAVSFSEDSSLFVTAGIRHVRFWYLEHTLTEKQSSAVPLMGRSGLLGELQNNLFTAVACGRGPRSDSTFCLTASGLLCEFSGRRVLERWVNLQSSSALSLAVSEDLIFCACADGTVRVFSPTDLRFLCTLPRPHHLGIDVSIATQSSVPDCRYPDCVALTFDPVSRWLTCVYSDHSLYVWDSSDLQAVSRVHSALYHSACVSDLQMCPSYGRDSFASCSSDNTIRFWSPDAAERSDRLSKDLHHVLYVDQSSAAQLHVEESESADGSSGIRTIAISPDGRHLASGDRHGTLRIHDLTCMKEVMKTEAHDSEILCLEYSRSQTGINLLASASRDRLIRVLDVDEDYRLMQTLDEHSSSVTSVHFTGTEGKLRMISCGADKSIYIRTAHRTVRGTEFKRTHHVVRQSTPSDMDVDPTYKYAAVGFQDRSVRLINISSGKQKRSFRGCQTEDGSLLKVHVDPSGLIMATSCSDKNISLLDFHSGEILDVIFGHSEIITALRFSSDCRRLVSASADSCIFVWRLDPQLTISMKERLKEIRHRHGRHKPFKRPSVAGLMLHRSSSVMSCSSESDRDDDEEDDGGVMETQRPQQLSQAEGASDQTRDASTLKAASAGVCAESAVSSRPPRRRWSCRVGSLELMVKSMLELRQLDSQSESAVKSRSSGDQLRKEERRSTSSLQDWTVKCSAPPPHSACVCPACAPDPEGVQLYSDQCVSGPPCCTQTQHLEAQSPVSAASMGYGSAGSSPDRRRPDVDDALGSCERTEDDHTRLICEPESLQLEDVLKTDTEDAGSPVVADSLHSQTSSNRPVVFAPQAGKCSAVVKPSLSSVRPLLEDRDVERPALRCVSQRSRRSISPVSRTPSAPHTSAPAHHSRRSLPASRLPKLSLEKLEVRSQCRLSSPSSPSSPQPWDSPNSTRSLRSRSYMSPTTSSRAKTSRCASIGEGLHHSSCESLEHPPKAAKPRLSQRWSSAFQSPRFSASQPDLSFKHGVSEEADPRPAGALSSSSSIIHTSPRAAVTVFTSDHQESLSVDVCRSAALDLCSSVTRAARLYRTLISYDADCSGEQQQMQQVMSDALLHARSELDSLPGSSVMRRMMMMMEDRKSTVALLEQYSQLLLRSLEERLQQHRSLYL